MFELMQSVMLIFIEIMCCKIFYETFGEVRYKGWINTIQFILLLSCICFLSYGFSEYFVIRQVVGILIFSVFMLWHVRISLKKSFVLAVLFDALLLAMDASVFLIMGWLSLDMEISDQQHQVVSVLAYLLVKVISFLLILVIKKRFAKKSMEKMLDKEWLRFLFFPLFTILAISAMLFVFEYVQTVEQANLLIVIAFGMVGMNIVVFYLINDIVEKEMKMHENKIFQIQAKNQLEMYQSISESFDNQKEKHTNIKIRFHV